MGEYDDPDGYYEPEEPEISGPVAPSRCRAVVRRLAQLVYPRVLGERLPREVEFARPLRTGPPAE